MRPAETNYLMARLGNQPTACPQMSCIPTSIKLPSPGLCHNAKVQLCPTSELTASIACCKPTDGSLAISVVLEACEYAWRDDPAAPASTSPEQVGPSASWRALGHRPAVAGISFTGFIEARPSRLTACLDLYLGIRRGSLILRGSGHAQL